MNKEQIVVAFVALHCPAAREQLMVYEVWEDGEVTLTKGADLYGRRNLHMIEHGFDHALPIDALPLPAGNGHARIMCIDRETADRARSLVAQYVG